MTRIGTEPKRTVLLLVDRRQSRTARLLSDYGFHVITTYTPDHAVATCVNNKIDMVILDQQHFVETEGWSVAKSIKMVRASICVILVVHGKVIAEDMPEGIDAVITERDHRGLLTMIDKILAA